MISSRFAPYLRDLEEYTDSYPSLSAETFDDQQEDQITRKCDSLLIALAQLPADTILEDFLAVAVAYHDQIRASGDRLVVTRGIQQAHSAVVQVLDLSDPEEQQFLAILLRIQLESEKGLRSEETQWDADPEDDGEDEEEESMGEEYMASLFDSQGDEDD